MPLKIIIVRDLEFQSNDNIFKNPNLMTFRMLLENPNCRRFGIVLYPSINK